METGRIPTTGTMEDKNAVIKTNGQSLMPTITDPSVSTKDCAKAVKLVKTIAL